MKRLNSRFKKIDRKFLYIDLLIIILILILPYYIFEGKLFIGGDETRLQYIYPLEWIKRIYFFSWYSFSPLGTFNSIQFTIPFLSIFAIINKLIPSPVVVNYLAFSSPLILGYVFSKKFIQELNLNININNWTLIIGALFYVFSPILIYKIVGPFLFATWLVGYFPIVGLIFLKFLKTGNIKYLIINAFVSILFSIVFISIPWIVGVILPFIFAAPIALLLFELKEIKQFIFRSVIFLVTFVLTQAFWLVSYLSAFFADTGSYPASILSDEIKLSFITTVLATSGDNNIIYPLLNLFHRGLAFSSNWALKDVYLNFYDYTLYLNIAFVAVLFLGVIYARKMLKKRVDRVFVFLLATFMFALFFFTVNIGPLKDFFLWLGNIPGFVMFRNFYGKFAISYIIYFSLLFTLCLHVVSLKFPKKINKIYFALVVIIFINLAPIKQNINIPLWQTEEVYTTIDLPNEYISFMKDIENDVAPDSSILGVPLNVASYSIIKDEKSENIYAGSSPVRLFSGIPAFAGNFSFSSVHDDRREIAQNMNEWMQERDYEKLNDLLYRYNIGYIMVSNNIPSSVKDSFLFNYKNLPYQDAGFVNGLTKKEILRSDKGNYLLFTTNKKNTLISSENLTYKRINPIKYKLYIKNLSSPQEIVFLNTFNYGWKLFPKENPNKDWCTDAVLIDEKETSVCSFEFHYVEGDELSYTFDQPAFEATHDLFDTYANKWTIDSEYIIQNYDNEFYTKNADGSINVELVLYFVPQNYFYYGIMISSISIIVFIGWYLIVRRNEKNK